jgi:nucleoid-associated protein YgaU
MATVLSFAAFDPFGLVRGETGATSRGAGPAAGLGQYATVTAVLTAQPGPAGPLARPSVAGFGPALRPAAPDFTHDRYNPRSGRAVFVGHGRPGARIGIVAGRRVVVYTTVAANGRWIAAGRFEKPAGVAPLAFTIEQRDPLTGDLIVGGSISLHLPDRFRQSVNVADEAPDAAGDGVDGFRLVAVRAQSDSLGPAASEAFDRFFEAGDDRAPATPPRRVAQTWLEDANRSYQSEIVERLRRGGGGFAGADPESDRRQRERRFGADDAANDRGTGEGARIVADGDGERPAPTGLTGALRDWLATARRSYETEIIPRLSGEVPRDIRLREEREAERRAKEERRRRELAGARRRREATERAERERIDADRRRRQAEADRRAAEEEARRIAAERARVEHEAAERARLERERARMAAEAEAERRRQEAEREQAQRLAAERAERERVAALAADRRAEDEARRRAEELRRRAEAERARSEAAARERYARERAERERVAALERAAEERRAADEARRAEAERRRRLIAEAEAIRQRREAEQRRRLEDLRSRREEARQRLAERLTQRTPDGPNPGRRADDTRFVVDRRRSPDPDPPLPDKYLVHDGFTRRETTVGRTALLDARRNDPIRLPVAMPRSAWSGSAQNDRTRGRTEVAVKAPSTPVAAKRRSRVKAYRRRIAPRTARRCPGVAGRRITPPGTYVVKPGDSLWRIARRHYNRGSLYPVIYRANRRKIRVARLIYPCQRFRLPALRLR